MAVGDKNLVFKTKEFTGFLQSLRARLGDKTTMRAVIDSEVSKVCERAVELTGKADIQKIIKSVESKKVIKSPDGRYWALRNNASGRAIRDRMIAKRKAAIGLSKQSFYLLARRLGYEVKAPAFVKSAKALSGDTDRDVSIRRDVGESKYGVLIKNTMPILRFTPPGGTQAFFAALAGRINFYKQNLAHGVFNSVQATAKKYKGVIVAPR